MAIQSDQNRYLGFAAGQLVLLGVATIVLLVFAWTYVH
jgi:hypothetical protein